MERISRPALLHPPPVGLNHCGLLQLALASGIDSLAFLVSSNGEFDWIKSNFVWSTRQQGAFRL